MSFILESRKKIKVNDIEILDFIDKSFEYNINYDFYIVDWFRVNEDIEMRPDIASYFVFGSSDYWDLILKYNGISNPFALSRDDVLLIPDLSWLSNCVVKSGDNQEINSKIVDQYKVDTLNYEKIKKRIKEISPNSIVKKNFLPPNILDRENGEDIIKETSDKIILGELWK